MSPYFYDTLIIIGIIAFFIIAIFGFYYIKEGK